MTNRIVLRSRRVELPSGESAADVVIQNGKILSVESFGAADDLQPDTVNDVGDLVVLPGLVDTHVHLNEPGREHWEGFETGTSAAKAGGVTTLVDMPLNSLPVTTTPMALSAKRKSAENKIHVDVGFHCGLVPDNAASIDSVIDAGTLAVKAFLCPSGIDEFPHSTEAILRTAMPRIASCNVPLMVHAEQVHDVPPMADPYCYQDYLASRPVTFERHAIELMIRLAREIGCHVHIVHLSDAGSLPMIAAARQTGVRLTVETCPHYLFFEAEAIDQGRTDFKCAPPIRESSNREQLWSGLSDGLIDMIVSDHSPCPPEMKQPGRFDEAWGGISSLQIGLPVIWTEASKRGFSLTDVVGWMSTQPAALVNLAQGIAPGNPAHLVVFDPEARWIVDQNALRHRHSITPYHGRTVQGMVRDTYVHGVCGPEPAGKLL